MPHYAALTEPAEYAQLLRDIDNYRGEITTKAAMQLLALTFQRTKEVRFAEWSQFDLDAALWRVPAATFSRRFSMPDTPPRIVLDTNVLYAGLYSASGKSYQLLRAIADGRLR